MAITYGPAAAEGSVSLYFAYVTDRMRRLADVLDSNYPARLQGNVSVQQALMVYFGVAYPLGPGDQAFVDELRTVFAAMNSCLNTWATVYVEYLGRADHDRNEYAQVLPPVIHPTADGRVDPGNPNSVQAGWADVQANMATIRNRFTYHGHDYHPSRELGFRINLNVRFRNCTPELKRQTIIHELSHVLADTEDVIGGHTYYADTVAQGRLLRNQAIANNADSRELADCWGWFAMDCNLG